MKLLISLATRNRPDKLIDTVKRTSAAWTDPDTRLMIQADSDDYATLGVLTENQFDERIIVNIGKREDTIATKWNRALKQSADLYLIAGDDDPVVQKGYDSALIAAATKQLPDDRIGMVYGHMANASFSNIMAVTKEWANILGYILPEHFPYWFSDHWIDDLGRITERIAFADVKSERGSGGSPQPFTQELREPAWWATWFDANYLRRRAEAAKLIAAIDEPESRKAKLSAHHPLVEFRSKWINDTVRAQGRGLEAMANLSNTDQRYMRVKNAAIQALPPILNELPRDEAQRYAAALLPSNVIVAPPQAFPPMRVVG